MSKEKQKQDKENAEQIVEFMRLRSKNYVTAYRYPDYAGPDGKVVGKGSVISNSDIVTTEKGIEEMANEK